MKYHADRGKVELDSKSVELSQHDNDLIENAVLAFLHHYPEHNWADDYKILLAKVRGLNEQSKDITVQKRGRPAKRQRTQKAASNSASTEKVETPKEQT